MSKITIVYYTANTENPDFENRILLNIITCGAGHDLITVSQKPMTQGINVCVGEVGRSSYNQWRQLQIGAATAKTEFIALAESDFLYTKEHFNTPLARDDCFYAPLRVYQLCTMKDRLHKYIPMHKRYREGVSIVGRMYLLERLDDMLDSMMWKPGIEKPSQMLPHLHSDRSVILYKNETPIVTFRTDNGMHQHIHDDHPSGIDNLPFWGSAEGLMMRFGL